VGTGTISPFLSLAKTLVHTSSCHTKIKITTSKIKRSYAQQLMPRMYLIYMDYRPKCKT
jgi:hypothetical protein